jgi:glycosyltransferase involved in cell wall biosynthesis
LAQKPLFKHMLTENTTTTSDMTDGDTELVPYTLPWYESFRRSLGEGVCRHLGIYAIPDDLVLSVVIPVYNERETFHELLARVKAVPIRKQIVMVDDGSKDGTREMLQEMAANPPSDPRNEIKIVFHERNKGKGAALRTGFSHATGQIVIIQDADQEYDPSEFPRLLQPIVEQKADVVYGSRFLGDYSHRVLYFWHYLGNKFLTTLSNCFTNLNLTDMETCYKVFTKEVLQDILPTLKQDRFGFEPEITAKVARRRCRIYELSISYSGRTYDQGKKIGWRDGFKALWCIVRYWVAD